MCSDFSGTLFSVKLLAQPSDTLPRAVVEYSSDEQKPVTEDDGIMRAQEWSMGDMHVESGGHL